MWRPTEARPGPKPASSRTRPPHRRLPPAPAEVPAPAAAPAEDPYGDLMKLKELLDAGALTQAEFDTQKQKILSA
jgi:hypothetical protein